MRGVFQATIVNEAGTIQPSCSIAVTLESDASSPQLFDAITAGSTLGNPFNADANGFARFYVEAGTYRIVATSGAFSREWRHVYIASDAEADSFTGTLVGVDAVVTGDIEYRKLGTKVTLYRTGALTGTSNSTSFSITGAPAAIWPVTVQYVMCTKIQDASVSNVIGTCQIAVDGTLSFNTISGSVDPARAGLFTASGSKGLVSGWNISYDVS